ncbi:hypothetical protein [Luteipulveratus flavus]|uniref:Uncharacterized protein n=1 Tax=Luteipulveratus flavus TaxID=3031728 RepID=A0ABT6CAR0_9MICO|nr:hypothetical protein [Luteipulveratus sp. YIM 133296]MDF8265851.1 hypothetical protein [Luteipulveratus sp. YIM 133296]
MDDATLTQLLDDLTSPDPALRDEKAWSTVAEAVMAHQLTEDQRSQAAERARKHLRMNEIQAPSFAPLVVDVLVETGGWEDVWFERSASRALWLRR